METNWLVETTFFHFLKQQSTAASESFFSLTTRTYFSASPLCWHVETSFSFAEDSMCLFQFFFCWWKLIEIFRGKVNFYRRTIFRLVEINFFDSFQRFSKVKAAFPYSRTYFPRNPISG